MKKILTSWLVSIILFSQSYAASFPSLPMTIWWTLKNWSTNFSAGTKLDFYDWAWSLISSFTTTKEWYYWGNNPTTDINPTLPSYAWNLQIRLTWAWVNQILTSANITAQNIWTGCPDKWAIIFNSWICRYDINIASTVAANAWMNTFTWAVTLSWANSTGIVFSSTWTLQINSSTWWNAVILPTNNLNITASWGWWDWVFIPPTVTVASWAISVPAWYTRIPSLTFKIWSETNSLILSWWSAMVNINVWTAYNWKILKIYRADNTQSQYSYLADCTVASWICSFSSNHFSVFSLAEPVAVSPPATVPTAPPASSWGGGGWIVSVSTTVPTTSTVSTSTGTATSSTWTVATTIPNAENKSTAAETKTQTVSTGPVFNDIFTSFAKTDIEYFVSKWVIKWFPDWSFKPNLDTTRAEFLAIIMKWMDYVWLDPSVTKTSFTDVKVWWMIRYVEAWKKLGINWQIIDWKSVFRPNDSITRAEALAIIFKVANLQTQESSNAIFADIESPWMIKYVNKAKELWITSWQTVNWRFIFRPNDWITRAETLRMLTKALSVKQ